jgi:hypothetical protein
VINACRSSVRSETMNVVRNGMWSVTDAFLEAGVPAVLGMRNDVAGVDAATYATAFYQSLIAGKALDVAAAEARREIWNVVGLERREWAAPCLEVRYHPEQILAFNKRVDTQIRSVVLNEFSSNRQLVDRRDEKMDTWQQITSHERNVLVIRGESGVGKTNFAKLLMERCSLFDHYVHYVDLAHYISAYKNNRPGDFLTVLRAIRDPRPDPEDPAHNRTHAEILVRPLRGADFSPFNKKVNQVLEATPPEDQENNDQMKILTQEGYRRSGEIIRDFRFCLDQSEAGRPLIIVLDHWDALNKADFIKYLAPDLLGLRVDPYDTNTGTYETDVRFILLLTRDRYNFYELVEFQNDFHLSDMERFELEDWEELAMEYLRRTRTDKPLQFFEDSRIAIPLMKDIAEINGPWKPVKLKIFERYE